MFVQAVLSKRKTDPEIRSKSNLLSKQNQENYCVTQEYNMCTFSNATLKGDNSLIIDNWGMKLIRKIDKALAAVPNDTTKRCSIGSLTLLIYHIYQISYDSPRVLVSFPIPHSYSHNWLKV